MKVGYIRISTIEQNEARQEVLMEQLGVDRVYMDKMSGKNKDRPQMQEMMQYVREGDIVMWSPSPGLPAIPKTCCP